MFEELVCPVAAAGSPKFLELEYNWCTTVACGHTLSAKSTNGSLEIDAPDELGEVVCQAPRRSSIAS